LVGASDKIGWGSSPLRSCPPPGGFRRTSIGSFYIRWAGVWGFVGEKPSNKKRELFELYKKLVALRKNHPALKIGEFFTHFVNRKNNVYSYLRRSESQEILIVLNNSAKTRRAAIPSPRNWKGKVIDLLGRKYEIVKGKIHASLKPYSGLILKTA